jgi:HTH-type transcriptional regulator/antitoxin HigA
MSTTKTGSPTGRRRDNARYLELVRRFPLRPIRTKRDYRLATKVMEELAIRGEDDLNGDERDYLDVLTDLVEA